MPQRKIPRTPKKRPSNAFKYRRLLGSIPFGYEISDFDPKLLKPIPKELAALEKAYEHLKYSSYREVARWLSQTTGRQISAPGLYLLVKRERRRQEILAAANRMKTFNEC